MRFVSFLLLFCVAACATRFDRSTVSESRLVEIACSPYNPTMQTTLLEAAIAGGGPRHVDIAGWMCGRLPRGYVRIVFLRFPPGPTGSRPLVPAVFENGSLVAFGWYLLATQPNRYGTVVLPTRSHPWEAPAGWSVVEIAEVP